MPFSDKVSISTRIESQEERTRLKRLLLSIKPRNFGLIIRTVAQDVKVATFDSELRSLTRKWESAFENISSAKPPKLLLSELNRTTAILRDLLNVSFNSIIVDEESLYNEIRDYISTIAPEKKRIVQHYKGKTPIFENFKIEKKIKSLFGSTVSFKGGAYLIIDHTEALHVIDVNSGNRSKSSSDQATNAIEVNLAAADEIARQLRLRDMGGIIVVDFIDMQSSDHRLKLFERMKKAMADDRTKHNILPLSKFGLMQLTRQRVRPEMNIAVAEKCPTCGGTGDIGPSLLFDDKLKSEISSRIEEFKLKSLEIKVHPYLEAYLNKGWNSIRKKWIKEFGCKLKILPESSLHYLEYRLHTSSGEEIPL